MRAEKRKNGKKIIAYMLVLSLALSLALAGRGVESAEAASSGDWNYEAIGSDIKITGYTGTETDVRIPETIMDSDGKNYQVKQIGECAFKDCSSLTSVSIPSGVTKLGDCAFIGCSSLSDISLPDAMTEMGLNVFCGCSSLTQVTLPDGITEIPFGTFRNCEKLADIQFSDELTSIGNFVFDGCSSLTQIEIPEGVTSLGTNVFYHCTGLNSIKLPSTLESIGKKAFVGTSLESLEIPENVSSIGEGLFNGLDDYADDSYTKIKRIVVDEQNTTYDSRDNCNAIIETATDTLLYGSNSTNIIPEGVKVIGKYSFSGCKELESIEIPSTVNDVEGHIFAKCSNLSKIIVSPDNRTYDSRGDCNGIVETSSNILVSGCKATVIPAEVSEIQISAFSGCDGLLAIELPSAMREIKDMTFLGCTGLTSVRIPSGVTSIGISAFSRCKNLRSVYIPASVEKFGEFANESSNVFAGCSELVIYTV